MQVLHPSLVLSLRELPWTACDLFGPCIASASLILLTAPAVYFTSVVSSPVSFLLVRFFMGFSCHFCLNSPWMSSMFSAPVVGTANGVAGGWGNLGGGATQLIMPLVFGLIHDIGAEEIYSLGNCIFRSARWELQEATEIRDKAKDKFSNVFYHGVTNYRGWILALTYGIFYDRFDLKLHTAGIIAASFGLVNIVSRPAGGLISDVLATRFAMRRCTLHHSWTSGILNFIHRTNFLQRIQISKERGITLMGIMIICCTLSICLIYFPQWGGMFCGPSSKKIATEEDYYTCEWNSKEKEQGLHQASLKYADNSRSERGSERDRRADSETRPPDQTSSTNV
ncbi:hypothetical protein P3X46_033813 [Hevea brasiliensis]|uniref:Major facilitator superfamily (MFS) profile domain-containing protein n=1 Tax=Hevea brasiliensis TaxID=3981 RepID=A0ABQ9KCB4_HEVBR|nr:hypothetical protein P3X46_033813 [Hevea brasiliensis]